VNKSFKEEMNTNNKSERKSIRLKGYDYSKPEYYYVTICTKGRECLFSEITDQGMVLNDAGLMVEKVWNELPIYYQNVSIDASQLL
jgi:hypothetical protein